MTFHSDTLTESNLPNLIHRGKVRDTHRIDDDTLLMVSTDRISAYDVIMPNPIPGKGAVLNQMASFWFNKTKHLIENHLLNEQEIDKLSLPKNIRRRAMLVRQAERIDIECVARGYITGSAMDEYKESQSVASVKMPSGMVEGDPFPQPIFTPATKAEEGHDENISIDKMKNLVGSELTKTLMDITIDIYQYAHDYAIQKGIIIADTKLEFGFWNGKIILIDEMITPDSSRFWDSSGYKPGQQQPNFDKQFVRDYLNEQNWDRTPPGPQLPDEIVYKTSVRYNEAFVKLVDAKIN